MNIITSTRGKPYNEFVAEMLDKFEEHDIKGLAIVALTDDENFECYWRMSLADKCRVRDAVNFDIIDEFISVNADRYSEILNDEKDV